MPEPRDQATPWHLDGVLYAVDVSNFLDSDADGEGDFEGLARKLEHVVDLGATCVWVLPFYRTPNRDNGYDVDDHCSVAPSAGTGEDFLRFLDDAHAHDLRVMVDLVANHTSDQHPWFQRAVRDPRSRYRGFYVWRDRPPPEPEQAEPIFPTVEESVWTYHPEAGAYYYHRFYRFEPGLNQADPELRRELHGIARWWLRLGVDAFRIDAASHLIEDKGGTQPDPPMDVLRELRQVALEERPESALMGEADVRPERVHDYFDATSRLQLLMNFYACEKTWLALARGSSAPVREALARLGPPPQGCQWVNFLRNLDELDLEKLEPEEQEEVMRAFAPDPAMRAYGRGIRRRTMPMLGERARYEMAYSLLFALPGIPLVPYGDEIGIGENLELPGRGAARPVMQWDDGPNAGFSEAADHSVWRPPIDTGPYAYTRVNVAAQREDDASLLAYFRRLVATRRACPAVGRSWPRALDVGDDAVHAQFFEHEDTRLLTLHNLSPREQDVRLPADVRPPPGARVLLARGARPPEGDGGKGGLARYGYAWVRWRV